MSESIGQSFDRYHILGLLGEGGMAAVYKAHDPRLDRDVAIKVILPTRQFSPKFLERFKYEARVLAKLDHRNIVEVLDYGEHEGIPYLVMPFISGGTLRERMGKPIPYQQAARMLAPLARALEYTHQHGFIHRDIKPSNVLVTDSGELKISDFGIVKILETEETIDITGTGEGMGTAEYVAPEQALGETVDGRADIYSLGVVFYELVTGKKPYQGKTPTETILLKITKPFPSPSFYVPDLPSGVERCITKAMAVKPDDRYQDMAEFAGELENLAEGKIPGGDKKNWPGTLWLVGVIGVCLLLFGAAALFWNNRDRLIPTKVVTQTAPAASSALTAQPVTRTTDNSPSIPVPITPTDTLFPTDTPTSTTQPSSWKQGKLVYLKQTGASRTLYLQDLSSGEPAISLMSASGSDRFEAPALSPDGKTIVLYDDSYQMKLLSLDTLSLRTINPCIAPVFSPDGSQVICHPPSTNYFNIYETENWSIVDKISPGIGGFLLVSWSSLDEIAFANNSNSRASIWKINRSGGAAESLADTATENYAPAWSPNGQWIAYQSNQGKQFSDIWIMDRQGQQKRQLTVNKKGWARGPWWSPDGRWIAYVSNPNDLSGTELGEVYILSITTGEIKQVTDTGGLIYDWRVSWSK